MTIEQLGSIGEIVGAIATIGTLWYLAIQIRQGSSTTRASNFVQVMSEGSAVWDPIIESGEIADIYLRGLEGFDALTDVERIRFHMVLSKHFGNAQLAFRLHQEGQLETELYNDSIDAMFTFAASSGVREWWRSARTWFHPEFAALLDVQFENAAQQSAAADSAQVGKTCRTPGAARYTSTSIIGPRRGANSMSFLRAPGGRQWWRENRHQFRSYYVDWLEQQLGLKE